MKIKALFYTIIFSLLVSCTPDSNNQEITFHPIDEKNPHSDVSAKELEVLDGSQYRDRLPENLQLLQKILSDESFIEDFKKLNILVSGRVEVIGLGDSALLILDKQNDQLVQYDLHSENSIVVAGVGRGPGDLLFSQELSSYQDKVFVSMQGFRISIFICENERCAYEKTIMTNHNNYSLTANEQYIYYIGVDRIGHDDSPSPELSNQNIIYKIDYDGDLKHSFLPNYNFWAPVVRDQMTKGGKVRLFPELERIITTFEFLPYLYLHDTEGNLINKYMIPDFLQAYYRYEEQNESEWSGRLLYDSNTTISFTSTLNGSWLFIRLREQRDLVYLYMEGFEGTEWYTYYAFDVEKSKLYRIGDDSHTDPYSGGRVINVLEQGLIINENGRLYYINNV